MAKKTAPKNKPYQRISAYRRSINQVKKQVQRGKPRALYTEESLRNLFAEMSESIVNTMWKKVDPSQGSSSSDSQLAEKRPRTTLNFSEHLLKKVNRIMLQYVIDLLKKSAKVAVGMGNADRIEKCHVEMATRMK